MNDNVLNILKNIVDNKIENYLGMPPVIDKPRSKCRAYGTTKKKRDKEKESKKKKIANKSRKINRRK